jgi:hypothetical protein
MTPNPAALITKYVPMQQNRFPRQMVRKDRPACTHCGVAVHTVDKCYKQHGYPPRFKFTKRLSFSPSSSVNHVTLNHGENSSETLQIPQLPIIAE